MDDLLSRLTVCGLDEIEGHRDKSFTHVISLISPGSSAPDIPGSSADRRHLVLSIDDQGSEGFRDDIPQSWHIQAIADFADAFRRDVDAGLDRHLLVHCEAGVSRSTAATIIVLARWFPQATARDLFGVLARLRPCARPNERMIALLDAALRDGRGFVRALDTFHRRRGDRQPDLPDEWPEQDTY